MLLSKAEIKSGLVKAAMTAGWATGFHKLFENKYGGVGSIFMLHRVLSDEEFYRPNAFLRDIEITESYLRKVLNHLKQKDYDFVSLDEALNRLKTGDVKNKFAVFTLDDGYRDNLTRALPIFEAFNAPFTVYVTTGLVAGTHIPWWYLLEELLSKHETLTVQTPKDVVFDTSNKRLKRQAFDHTMQWLMKANRNQIANFVDDLVKRYGVDAKTYGANMILSIEELKRLAASPLATIGAHSVSHPALANQTEADADFEISCPAIQLQEWLNQTSNHYCYPYGGHGECGEREFELVKNANYKSATTTQKINLKSTHKTEPYALPRLGIKGTHQQLRYLDTHLSGFASALYS